MKDPEFNASIGLFQTSILRQDWHKRVHDYNSGKRRYPEMAQAFIPAGRYYRDFSFFADAEPWPFDSEEQKIFLTDKKEYARRVVDILAGDPSNVDSACLAMLREMHRLGLDKLNEYVTIYLKQKKDLWEKYGVDLNLPY